MSDKEALARILMQSNDPEPTDVWDYYRSRSDAGGRDPRNHDMSGMYPMSERPGMDLAANGTQATLYALIAKMMADAPGPLKLGTLPSGYMALDKTGQALRNYQQLQGTHPMQLRQGAWERLMDAAARPTDETQFQRGRFSGER